MTEFEHGVQMAFFLYKQLGQLSWVSTGIKYRLAKSVFGSFKSVMNEFKSANQISHTPSRNSLGMALVLCLKINSIWKTYNQLWLLPFTEAVYKFIDVLVVLLKDKLAFSPWKWNSYALPSTSVSVHYYLLLAFSPWNWNSYLFFHLHPIFHLLPFSSTFFHLLLSPFITISYRFFKLRSP